MLCARVVLFRNRSVCWRRSLKIVTCFRALSHPPGEITRDTRRAGTCFVLPPFVCHTYFGVRVEWENASCVASHLCGWQHKQSENIRFHTFGKRHTNYLCDPWHRFPAPSSRRNLRRVRFSMGWAGRVHGVVSGKRQKEEEKKPRERERKCAWNNSKRYARHQTNKIKRCRRSPTR